MAEAPAFTFVWRIENFGEIENWDGVFFIESEEFVVHYLEDSLWNLRIVYDLNTDEFHLYLDRGNDEVEYVFIVCELSFLTADGIPLVIRKSSVSAWDVLCYIPEVGVPRGDVFGVKRSAFLPEDTLTVRCRFWKPDEVVGQPMHHSALSRIRVKGHTASVSIEDVKKLRLGENKTLKVVSAFDGTPTAHKLKLVLHGSDMTAAEIDVIIEAEDAAGERNLRMCKLSLVNGFRKLVVTETQRDWFSQEWCCREFFRRKELMERTSESLKFRFSIPYFSHCKNEDRERTFLTDTDIPNPVTNTSVSQPVEDAPPTNSLHNDLLSFYREHTFSDFQLFSEGVSFPVHKFVLCARSPVFKAMLTTDMKETVSGVLNVPDVDADTLQTMLLFIYSDTVEDLQWESIAKLYYAADKYDILSLRNKCSSNLRSNIDVSNVFHILELSDRHNDQQLKLAVEEFLLDHADKIFNSADWERFANRNSQLAAKTVSKMFSRITFKKK